MFDPQHFYSLDEYWHIAANLPDQKYEYVDGDIRMMTGGSPAHAQIAARIAGLLDRALYATSCNVYGSDVAVEFSQKRIYYPDVSISCDLEDRKRKKSIEAPAVIVEVHSPSTEKIDRGEKLLAYQQHPTVQEIVFVDSRKHFVEHHHRSGISKWEHFLYADEDDVVELTSIDTTLLVRDIYHKVYLELED
ncbi:Uma2 family endonuclease [Dictyobacter arantiisoli]|uniref:Putative restriction endonuclease domain-containing protein n=1 Tax=Dictyobacter arantiisoli TaxID=2014874 RepID=A0A5A5T6J4_9CHLR|nr:Uma2 family endonuclease [Dictyobacter arantiisoli]GCF06845.1 hypothetical protein KDI_04090 [Dictyobacter arantiisoli]